MLSQRGQSVLKSRLVATLRLRDLLGGRRRLVEGEGYQLLEPLLVAGISGISDGRSGWARDLRFELVAACLGAARSMGFSFVAGADGLPGRISFGGGEALSERLGVLTNVLAQVVTEVGEPFFVPVLALRLVPEGLEEPGTSTQAEAGNVLLVRHHAPTFSREADGCTTMWILDMVLRDKHERGPGSRPGAG